VPRWIDYCFALLNNYYKRKAKMIMRKFVLASVPMALLSLFWVGSVAHAASAPRPNKAQKAEVRQRVERAAARTKVYENALSSGLAPRVQVKFKEPNRPPRSIGNGFLQASATIIDRGGNKLATRDYTVMDVVKNNHTEFRAVPTKTKWTRTK
jgi:hypothetical protein